METKDPDDAERPRALLSPSDREWIKGQKEYKHRQSHVNKRNTVHERIRNGIYDLELLFNYPEKIEDERIYIGGGVMGSYADASTTPAIGFLLRHRLREFIDYDKRGLPDQIHTEGAESMFGKMLSAAIRRSVRGECGRRQDSDAVNLPDFRVTVDVDIEYLDPRPDHVVELEHGIEDGNINTERLLRIRDEVPIDVFYFDELMKKIYAP